MIRCVDSERFGRTAGDGETSLDAETRFVSAFEEAPIGMALVAPDGRWLRVNRAVCAITGYSEAELLGGRFQDITHPDDLGEDLALVEQVLSGRRRTYQLEKRYIRKGGGTVWVRLSVSLIRDSSGDPVQFISQIEDITERRRLREELEQRSRLMDLAHDAIIIRDPDSRVVWWNREAHRLYGYQAEEAIGRISHQLLESRFPISRDAVDAALASRGRWEGELRHRRKDGRWIVVSSRQALQRSDTGDAIAIIEINADVTEQRLTQEAVREAQERYRQVVDTLAEGVVLFDRDGRNVQSNPAGARLVGLPSDDLEGAQIGDRRWLTLREDGSEYPAEELPADVSRRTGRPQTGVIMGMHSPDGSLRWLSVNTAPLNSEGPPFPVVASFVDITELKRTERDASQRLADLQSFLVGLTDRMRGLDDPEAIQFAAAELLGRHLGVSRVGYADDGDDGESVSVIRNYTDGVPGIEGRYRYEDYGPHLLAAFRAGRTVVRPDIARDPSTGAEAAAAYRELHTAADVNVPLIKAGKLVGVLFVHHRRPRSFSVDDVRLIEAVADQTWWAVQRARAEAAMRQAQVRAEVALDAASMGSFIWYVDEDRAEPDPRMRAMFGLEADDPLTLAEALDRMIIEEDRAGYAEAVSRALNPAGNGRLDEEIRVVHRDGSQRWLAILGRTAFAGDPPVAESISGATIDITEIRRAEQERLEREERERQAHRRTALLAELLAELEREESLDRRLGRLVEILAGRAADYVWLETTDADGGSRRFAAGEPVESPPSHQATEVILPLSIGAGDRSTLVLGFTDPEKRTVFQDREFMAQVGARLEVNLGAAKLREQEHAIALGLQRALLPDRLVEHPEVQIAARYEAGSDVLEVGGDWYDIFGLGDDRLGICVGDVVGHGLAAAAAMGRLRVALATLASHETRPGHVLASLDQVAAGPNGVPYATAAYAILDPRTGELSYASAGHPPMLLLTPDGRTEWLNEGRSVPLCGWPDEERPQATVRLAPGSLLVFYSDGLVERRDEPIDRGIARLEDAVRELSGADPQQVCDALIERLGVARQRADDVVVVCVRTHAGPV
jgi:PAS domain S-box-containing protein